MRRWVPLVVILLTIAMTATLFWFSCIEQVNILAMKVKVADTAGFNVETSSLNFGKLTPHSQGMRSIEIQNSKNNPLQLTIKNYGVLAPYIHLTHNNIIIPGNSTAVIEYQLTIPENFTYGNYTSTSIVILKNE